MTPRISGWVAKIWRMSGTTSERFQAAYEKAGLPKGLFQNVVLTHEQTEKLIGSGKVNHVNFTGSVAGGRAVERAAAGSFASLGLELGGKDPAYVREDVKLDHAVENLVDGSFYNSGQCCCGIERIYVHERVYQPFVDAFVDLTRKYVVGDPLDQVPVVAGDHQRPRPRVEQVLQRGEGVGVQVVGRLVEEQHVRLARQQPEQLQPPPLPAGEVPDRGPQPTIGETEHLGQLRRRHLPAAQHHPPGHLLHRLQHPQLGRQLREVL